MTGNSGSPGPKRKEGDLQIPEGVYQPLVLNPQSRFYLSIGLNYPNALDQKYNTDNPGSDIYIHGGSATIGCVPIGDPAIEELFLAVEVVGLQQTMVYIYSDANIMDEYTKEIYADLKEHLQGHIAGW